MVQLTWSDSPSQKLREVCLPQPPGGLPAAASPTHVHVCTPRQQQLGSAVVPVGGCEVQWRAAQDVGLGPRQQGGRERTASGVIQEQFKDVTVPAAGEECIGNWTSAASMWSGTEKRLGRATTLGDSHL